MSKHFHFHFPECYRVLIIFPEKATFFSKGTIGTNIVTNWITGNIFDIKNMIKIGI